MPPLYRLLWRLFVASLGFLAAVTAAFAVTVAVSGIFPLIGSIATATFGPALAGVFDRADLAGAVSMLSTRYVFPAWLVLVLVFEVVAMRSLLLHLVAFATIAVLAVVAAWPQAPGEVFRVVAAGGFAGGFLHWLVAGRGAGVTMRAEQSSTEGDPRPPHA